MAKLSEREKSQLMHRLGERRMHKLLKAIVTNGKFDSNT